MSLLDKLKQKTFARPMLMLLYGPIGCGKTSFAACFKDSAFVVTPKERGIDQVKARGDVAEDYPVYMPSNWKELRELVKELGSANHGHKTLVFDSLSSMQEMAFAHVCATTYQGDFAKFNHFCKGHRDTEGPWSDFMADIEALRDKGIAIVMIAHTMTRTIDDPQHGNYTMWLPDLYDSEKQGSLLKPTLKHATEIGFIDYAIHIDTDGRAQGGTKRVLHLQRSAAWEAKNQRGIRNPIPLGDTTPQDAYKSFVSAFQNAKVKA